MLEQQPAGDRADRDGDADAGGPDADGPAPLVDREDVGDDGQGGRHDRRAAEAHQGAGRDQLPRILRVRAGDGRDPEEDHAEQQHALTAVAVAEDAEGEQQAREDEGVGVHRPFELALGGAQAVNRIGDRLDRDVEDGVVENHGEEAEHHHAEDLPPAWMSHVCVHRKDPPGHYDTM
jgi:hypothetical protein